MGFKMKGFDKLQKELKRLERNARNLDSEHSLSFAELFPDSFMRKNTKFQSMQEMFDSSPFTIETEGDFKAIPDNEWDEYVRSNTNFSSWELMQEEAISEWTSRKLGF